MLLRLRLITICLSSAFALLLMLCLGAQNLNSRHELQLGNAKTAPLPAGFLVGVSIIVGVFSGGSTTALLIPTTEDLDLINEN